MNKIMLHLFYLLLVNIIYLFVKLISIPINNKGLRNNNTFDRNLGMFTATSSVGLSQLYPTAYLNWLIKFRPA